MKIHAESQAVTCGDTHMKRQTQTQAQKRGTHAQACAHIKANRPPSPQNT